jgi:hypothetical protein
MEEFNEARRSFLKQWRPEMVVVADRWDSRFTTREELAHSIESLVTEVGVGRTQVLLIAQAPVAEIGAAVNLRDFVQWQRARGDGDVRIEPDSHQGARRQILDVFSDVSRRLGDLWILRADPPFTKSDGSIRFAEGRTFYSADDDHLTEEGTELLRPSFRDTMLAAHRAASAVEPTPEYAARPR